MKGRVRLLAPWAGALEAPVWAWNAPLSFWGGLDPLTGRVSDRHHPGFGRTATGTILCLPSGRGSSSSSSVLAESLRLGTGPAAILLLEADPVIVTGALVAEDLYGAPCPVGVVEDWAACTRAASSPAAVLRGGDDGWALLTAA